MRRRPPETLPLPSLPVAASYSRNGRTVKESPAFAPRRGVAGDDFLSRRAASRNTLRAAQSGRKGRGRRSPVTNDRTGPVLALVGDRSEEHTSELQSLMRISYAVFCLKKKTQYEHNTYKNRTQTQEIH